MEILKVDEFFIRNIKIYVKIVGDVDENYGENEKNLTENNDENFLELFFF